MANENFFPGQIPGQPLGTGEGESPLAKPVVPNTDVRTMASDIQSINTGAPAPKPYAPQTSAPENLPTAPSFQIPQMDAVPLTPQEPPAPKKGMSGLFVSLISLIAVLGLAALGYFVVYPIFFAAPAEIINTNNEVVPATNQEAVLPEANEPIPPIMESPTTTEPISEQPAPVLPSRISAFSIPADAIIESASAVTGAALSGLKFTASSSPNIAEIVYKNSNGDFIKFADILKATTGADISGTSIENSFNDQSAAGLVYTDKNGVRWLGLIAPLKTGENLESDMAAFKTAFEKSADYNNLFIGDAGAQKVWKSSAVAGLTGHQYLLFANASFAIDYGWVGNKVIIMTSFDGLKEAIKRI